MLGLVEEEDFDSDGMILHFFSAPLNGKSGCIALPGSDLRFELQYTEPDQHSISQFDVLHFFVFPSWRLR